jgi:hypothetical protein
MNWMMKARRNLAKVLQEHRNLLMVVTDQGAHQRVCQEFHSLMKVLKVLHNC